MSMVLPGAVGFKLSGKLCNGVTATYLVLTVTQMLLIYHIDFFFYFICFLSYLHVYIYIYVCLFVHIFLTYIDIDRSLSKPCLKLELARMGPTPSSSF